jgi:2-methylcitrate dehydratase PrpD
MDVTRILAEKIVGMKPGDVPAAVRAEAVRSLVNWAGCAVGGSAHGALDIALAGLAPFLGKPEASVLGRTVRTDMGHAALLNGIASHVFDFDDTHLKTIIHPAGPVASAVLAMAETHGLSGADVLDAFILGVEVECRIGNAVYPAHYDIGWHITGTAGVFGAAAATAKILGLDVLHTQYALGIAATQSAGLREMFGTMCKPFHPGRAAQNGLVAANLAKAGFTSSERSLEAPRGFANVLSTARNYAEITEGWGRTWEVALNTYKPFACGIVIHPSIDGCVQLRNAHDLKPADIKSISLVVHPLVLELTGKKTPRTGLEAKFSVYHSCAAAIMRGQCGEHEYSDDLVRDPIAIGIRDKVTAVAKPGIHEDQVDVTIETVDGRRLHLFVEHAIGSLKRPLTDAELDGKVHALCDPVIGDRRTAAMIGAWRGIGTAADMRGIIAASVKHA